MMIFMKIFPLIALSVTTVALFSEGHAEEAAPIAKPAPKKLVLPRLDSADLNGNTFVIPDNFVAPRTLLLIAFERNHQNLIDSWVEGLKITPEIKNWYELPVVGQMSQLRQGFLDNAMRVGIRGEDKRAHVVTLYIPPSKITGALGKIKTDTIYVAVVGRKGEVLALAEGAFDKTKARYINHIWRLKPTKER